MEFPKESVLGQSNLMVYYVLEKRLHSKISKFENDTKFLQGMICQNDRNKLCKVKMTDEFWPVHTLKNTHQWENNPSSCCKWIWLLSHNRAQGIVEGAL